MYESLSPKRLFKIEKVLLIFQLKINTLIKGLFIQTSFTLALTRVIRRINKAIKKQR